MSSFLEASDAELVEATLGGSRRAFGEIVERYQRLLCSLAYSATGRLAESEDVAQEAFVTAWKELRKLREPEKLKSWLCGILRHKIGRMYRSDRREPVSGAGALEELEPIADAVEPTEQTVIREEEQQLMWAALKEMPESYREPLVLFYREHQSVTNVAESLGLTEDAVKQRLSRGRKLLHERVLTMVEGALVRSTPGKAFTIAVLAALPALSPSAKAAGMGAVIAKGGSVAKWGVLAVWLGSFSGVFSGILGLRASLDQSRTQLERRQVVKFAIASFAVAIGFVALSYLLKLGALEWWDQRGYFAVANVGCTVAFLISVPLLTVVGLRKMRELRSSERLKHPERFLDSRDQIGSSHGEYRSKWSLFGIPLVHVRFRMAEKGDAPVVAWIAGGDRAYGILFAWGGVSVGLVSVGIVSVGVVSCGALGLGIFAIGTLAVGAWSFGAMSMGIDTFGSVSALGWDTAVGGGFAVARDAALGAVPYAHQVNNEAAGQIVQDAMNISSFVTPLLFGIAVLVIVPAALFAREVRRRYRKPEAGK